jgi:hypothetical protein
MKKTPVYLIVVFTLFMNLNAQDSPLMSDEKLETRHFRPTLQVGFPTMLGVNFEYLIHGLDNRVALDLSIGYGINTFVGTSFDEELLENNALFDVKIDWTIWNFGAKYYLLKPNEGFFVGANYGQFLVKTEVNNIVGDFLSVDNEPVNGEGAEIDINDLTIGMAGFDFGWTWITDPGFVATISFGLFIPNIDDVDFSFVKDGEVILKDTFVYSESEFGFSVIPKIQLRIGYAF